MGRKRYYIYHFSNDEVRCMSREDAETYALDNDLDITQNGHERFVTAPRNKIRDGFQAGYNPALGKYVGGRREHDRELQRAGLIEMGKDKPAPESEKESSYFTKELGKELSDAGVSDREIATMED